MDLFVKHGIYTPDEVQARYEIHAENYAAVTSIEAKTMADMIRRQILPAVSAFGAELCERMGKKLEALLPKEAWPFPVYGDILFY